MLEIRARRRRKNGSATEMRLMAQGEGSPLILALTVAVGFALLWWTAR